METATIFIVGHHNQIARGALLLVSDVPVTPDGVKTEASDLKVTERWSEIHLQIGIEAMAEAGVTDFAASIFATNGDERDASRELLKQMIGD